MCWRCCNIIIHLVYITEALAAIISFTTSAVELLRRRKIKRDLLFQYLYDEGVMVAPKVEKHVLVRHVLQHWESQPPTDYDLMQVG